MLIQLSRRLTIDPSHSPHQLVVELETRDGRVNEPWIGVFSGTHDGFRHPEEMNQRLDGVPIDEETSWIQRFEIRAPNRSRPNQHLRYHYVAISWHDSVYMAYPMPTEITLEDSAGQWSVSIGGMTLSIPDYSPWNMEETHETTTT